MSIAGVYLTDGYPIWVAEKGPVVENMCHSFLVHNHLDMQLPVETAGQQFHYKFVMQLHTLEFILVYAIAHT